MATQTTPFVTPAEYFEFDRNSEFKHEYISGEIVAMAGGTAAHGRISMNTGHALNKSLFGGPCGLFSSDVRVCLAVGTLYSYPDLSLACDPIEYTDNRHETLANPRLVVEVLSPSTRSYDLGVKTRMYLRVPSLTELLLIEQDKVWIEHWRRLPDGHWDVEHIEEPGATVNLASLGCELSVADIYMGIDFPAQQAQQPAMQSQP